MIPLNKNFYMQMVPGWIACTADKGYYFAPSDILPCRNKQLRTMGIQAPNPPVIFYYNIVPIAVIESWNNNPSAMYRKDFSAKRHCNVKPPVELYACAGWVLAVAIQAWNIAPPWDSERASEYL